MGFAIFILYLSFFCWLITRIRFFAASGLQKKVLVGLFVCKIIAGVVYAWFYALPQYVAGSDTWRFFEISKGETDTLLTNPLAYIQSIFQHGYSNSGNVFAGENSYWNDLKSDIVIKLIAICNVFTFKNYYADVILFNFIFFFGPVAFFRVMSEMFAEKKVLMVVTIFLLPSFLFWCSGLHKDGLIFTCLALLVYHFNNLLKHKKAVAYSAVISLLCLLCIFALRNVICLLLIPSLAIWFLCSRYPSRIIIVITGVYGACIMLFFLSAYIHPSLNFPQYAVDKQNAFKLLQGSSGIHVRDLHPNFMSFARFLPSALDIALLRPHISEMKNTSYLPAVLELFLLWSLAGLFIFSKKNIPHGSSHKAVIIFCFSFAFTYLLLSGYTVTFSGAIVRYKSIVLPFIFCPLTCMANTNRNMIIKQS